MKKSTVWVVVILAMLLGALSVVPAGASLQDPEIRISGFQYFPSRITVKPNAVVGVTNIDGREHGIPHSVTADNGSFDTGVFIRGTQAFRAPTVPGVYQYHCTVHPEMVGSLKVGDPRQG